jgi:hypothetical protein
LKAPEKFDLFAKSIRSQIEKEGVSEETLRARRILRNIRYVEGRQLGFISPKTGEWVDVVPLPSDPFYQNNQFKVMVRSVLKEWVRSNARLNVEPRDDRMESQGSARLGKYVIDLYRERLFRATEKHTEAMNAMLAGTYFRLTYWDMSIDTYKETVPEYQDLPTKIGPDSLYCANCGFGSEIEAEPPALTDPASNVVPPAFEATPPQDVNPSPTTPTGGQPLPNSTLSNSTLPNLIGGEISPLEEASVCPRCGEAASLMRSPTVSVPTVAGFKEVATGDIRTELPDPLEIKVHLRGRKVDDTPFIRRKRRMFKRALKMAFPNAKIKGGTKSGSVPLQIQEQLENSPGNYGAKDLRSQSASSGNPGELVEFEQIWLDRQMYYDYTFPEDFPLPNGEDIIPAGSVAGDIFKDGLYLAFVGEELVDVRNENKNKVWAIGKFFLLPSTFWGAGVEDGAELQRRLNEWESLIIESGMHTAAPPVFYNPLKISGQSLSGKPRDRVPLKNPNLTDKPEDFISIPDGRQLGADVLAQPEQSKRDLQAVFGAFSVISGMPDIDVKTATGMAILRDQALGFLGPPLELKGEVEVDWAYQVLELIQQNMTGKRYLKFGKYSQIEGDWFSAADIRTDLVISVMPDSIFPRNSLERRNDILEAGTAFGLPLGIWNPSVPPHLRRLAAERYDLPIDLDQSLAHQRKQRIELDRMRAALQIALQSGVKPVDQMGVPDARLVELVAGVAPPDPVYDDHATHFEWISNYLVSDDGMNEDPIIVEALKLHGLFHYQVIQAQLAAQQAVEQGPEGDQSKEQGGGKKSAPSNKKSEPKNSGPKKPDTASPTGTKKPGDNLPMVKAGSTEPGSQPNKK